ncbi:hypothetical protein D3C76_467770 [compost metagenome]
MPRPTMEKYIAWMKVQPRTYDWGALLVYDRFKTNRLLAQEHIENLELGHFMRPIDFSRTLDGLTTTVSDLKFDRPVLSFVNSSLGGSRARLSMNVVSGLIVQYRRPPGSSQDELVGYSNLDPLTAPTVRMDIFLRESNDGKVNDQGRVTLDLSKGGSYKFEVASWGELNDRLGEVISEKFQELDEKERVWELNVLKPVEGELSPSAFEVRTHSYAKAQEIFNASEEEKKEGAVIVGVAFEGQTGGNFPGQDDAMPYLLPSPIDDAELPYTMNLIYSNKIWLKQLLLDVIGKFERLQNVKVDPDRYGFYTNVTADLNFSVPAEDVRRTEHYDKFTVQRFKWPDMNLMPIFEIKHDAGVLTYNTSAFAEGSFVVEFVQPDGVKVMRPSGRITIKIDGSLELGLTKDSSREGDIDVVVSGPNVEYSIECWGSEWSFYDGYAKIAAEDYVMVPVRALLDTFVSQFKSLADVGVPFNLLRLNGLLFRGADVATPRSLQFPGDLSLLGDLAPKLTTFAIEPLETVISAGGGETVTLSLDPKPDGPVDWQVKPLKDESADAGTIVDGVYTPPPAASISGTHKRVIVTATASGNTSSALITVVSNSVAVYPYFLVAQFDSSEPTSGPPRYVLVGGDSKNELTWSMVNGSKGIQRLPEDSDSDLDIPEGKNVRIYVSPKRTPGTPGELEALVHLDRVQVSAGGLAQWIDVIVPWTTATAKIKATQLSEGAWQLAVAYDSAETGEEVELTPAQTKWAVLLGKGQINPATGVYQPGPSEGPYIIVAGRETPAERLALWSYSVVVLSPTAKHAVAIDTAFKKEA